MMNAEEILAAIDECGGLEVHQDEWPVAEELRTAGKITLSDARGPGRQWKRAEKFCDCMDCSVAGELAH